MNIPAEFDEATYRQILADILSQSDRQVAVQMIKDILQKRINGEIEAAWARRISAENSIRLLILPEAITKGTFALVHEYVDRGDGYCKTCERVRRFEMHSNRTDNGEAGKEG